MTGTQVQMQTRAELLLLAAADMLMARAAAVALLDDESGDPFYRRALETAIAVCYWRPFAESNTVGTLSRKDEPEREDWRVVHEWLREVRRKRYAHTDKESLRSAELEIVETDHAGVTTARWREDWAVLPVEGLPTIIAMCDAQAKRFLNAADELRARLADA